MYLFIAIFIFAFHVWLRTKHSAGVGASRWAFALTILLNLVFALHCQVYDCLWLSIAAVLTISKEELKLMRANPLSNMAYFVWLAILFSYPFSTWFALITTLGHNFKMLVFATNAVLLTAGTVCWRASLVSENRATFSYQG